MKGVATMKILKIRIEASSAHFAIPFFIFERRTFPIPMYSTAIGFICNALGDEGQIARFLRKNFSMSIVGNHEGVTEEYVWFRNLKEDSHQKRFISLTNRKVNDEFEHPGGQMPVKIQTLMNPKVDIFLKADEETLETLEESLTNPKWISRPHLGRGEDVIDKLEVGFVDCVKERVFNTNGYTWIPSPEFVDEEVMDEYGVFYEKIIGSAYKVSSIYEIKDRTRVFKSVRAKLFSGAIPMMHFNVPKILSWNSVPIFLAKIQCSE